MAPVTRFRESTTSNHFWNANIWHWGPTSTRKSRRELIATDWNVLCETKITAFPFCRKRLCTWYDSVMSLAFDFFRIFASSMLLLLLLLPIAGHLVRICIWPLFVWWFPYPLAMLPLPSLWSEVEYPVVARTAYNIIYNISSFDSMALRVRAQHIPTDFRTANLVPNVFYIRLCQVSTSHQYIFGKYFRHNNLYFIECE